MIGLLFYMAGLIGSISISIAMINIVVPHLLVWYVLSIIALVVGGVLSKLEI